MATFTIYFPLPLLDDHTSYCSVVVGNVRFLIVLEPSIEWEVDVSGRIVSESVLDNLKCFMLCSWHGCGKTSSQITCSIFFSSNFYNSYINLSVNDRFVSTISNTCTRTLICRELARFLEEIVQCDYFILQILHDDGRHCPVCSELISFQFTS